MKSTKTSLTLFFLLLGACQPVGPAIQPSPSATALPQPSATASPVPTPVPTALPSPSPSQSPSPTALSQYKLRIDTAFPSQPLLNALPLQLKGVLLKDEAESEPLSWEVLTPSQAEIRSEHLVLLQTGQVEIRAFSPSQPQLEQRFVFQVLPLPAPTPTPIPSLPPFERLTGILGDVVSAGKYVFVTDKTLERVHVLDTLTGKKVTQLNLNMVPEHLTLSPDRKTVYVASSSSERVGMIDSDSLQIQAPLPVGGNVFDLVAGPNRLYVSYADPLKPIAIFEPSTSSPKGKLPEEVPGRTLLALSTDQRSLYVGTLDAKDTVLRRVDVQNEDEPEVVVNTLRELTEDEEYLVKYRGLKIDPVLGIDLKDLKISPDGKKLYLALSSPKYPSKILVLDSLTLKEVQHLDIGAFPDSVDFSLDGKYLYVAHMHYDIHVFNRETLTQVYRQEARSLASKITATADGKSVVGLLGQNFANSPKSLARFLDFATFAASEPK
jgi:DNA-binding beta-propeller fold protein YncE